MQSAAATASLAFSAQRRAMVDGQIRTFDVTDQAVIGAFAIVPRETFLPPDLRSLAYSDAILTLTGTSEAAPRRVMLQPMHLARMMQGASVQPKDRVLVVAGGTGYAACVLAHLAAEVTTLESDASFTAEATALSAGLGLAALRAVTGRLRDGYAAGAPYNVILVQGAVETGLDTLFGQLSAEGCLVAIETTTGGASRRSGRAVRFQRINGDVSERPLFDATAPILAEFMLANKFVF